MTILDTTKEVSEIIQSFGVGIGALLGGVGALKVFTDWRTKRKAIKAKLRWKRLYPPDKLGVDFKLLRHSYSQDKGSNVIGSADEVYICDDRSNSKHWAANLKTLKSLGFNSGQVKGVAKTELEKYRSDEVIDLTD